MEGRKRGLPMDGSRFSKTAWAPIAAVAAGCCFSVVARGNDLPKLPLDEIARRATLVLVGKVTEVSSHTTPDGYVWSRFRMVTALKGDAPAEIDVMRVGPIAEENPACCVADGVYLLFLQPNALGGYFVVNGPNGAIRIEADPKAAQAE